MAASNPPPLAALNDHEREALRLLAQGHTVKSIAEITGRSNAAVNARLREARRKTGVPSSRELARLLAFQENRDAKIGIGSPAADQAPLPSVPRRSGALRYRKGAVIIIPIIAAIALAAAVAHHERDDARPDRSVANAPVTDPILGDGLPNMVGPGQYYRRVRGEPRDPAWADPTEQELSEVYRAMLSRYAVNEPVRVICGTTLCEVSIRHFAIGKTPEATARTNALAQEIQGKTLADTVATLGLTADQHIFGEAYAGYFSKAGTTMR